MRTIRCVVACTNANGSPDFFGFTSVNTTDEKIKNGEHYDTAILLAKHEGYDPPYLVFDEDDGPEWLFENVFHNQVGSQGPRKD